MKGVLEGLLCVFIGIVLIYSTYKHPVKGSILLPNLSGFLSGIGLIVVGILLIVGYLPPV